MFVISSCEVVNCDKSVKKNLPSPSVCDVKHMQQTHKQEAFVFFKEGDDKSEEEMYTKRDSIGRRYRRRVRERRVDGHNTTEEESYT